MLKPHHYRSELFAWLYFWPFVDVSRGPQGCWPWTGVLSNSSRTNERTYGLVRAFDKCVPANRYSLELKLGEELGERFSLHSCDNKPCCNPEHLRPGTHQDNMADYKARRSHRTEAKACVCSSCIARAMGPGHMNDPEVVRLFHAEIAEIEQQHELCLRAEIEEETYLDAANKLVNECFGVPLPTWRMIGPLLHQINKAEEEDSEESLKGWRITRAASSTCVERGHFGGAYAGTASPSDPANPERIMTLREFVASGVKFRGRLTEAQRAIVLASLREGYTLVETVASTEVWRSAALVRQDARVQGWAAELAAAAKEGALVRGER